MQLTDIIQTARDYAYCPVGTVSQSEALRYLNMHKDDFWSTIVSKADASYSWEVWTTDTVSLQSEYQIPEVTRTAIGTKAVHGVAINYDGTTFENTGKLEFIRCREVSPTSLEHTWEWYEENQSKEDPIFRISDNSIFVAPVPLSTEAGTGRLQITGIRSIPDYTINGVDGATVTTTEQNMRIPLDRQKTLVKALASSMFLKRGQLDTATKWEQMYNAEKEAYADQLTQRASGPVFAAYPDSAINPVDPLANTRI